MRLSLAFLALFLSACPGDDDPVADAPAAADAPSAFDAGPDGPLPSGCTCFALGVDFSSGVGIASTVTLPQLEVTTDVVPGAISSDPVVRRHDGMLYVVNRFGADNVTVIDPASWTVTAQWSTGGGSNPQDVAISAGGKAYVAALGVGSVLVYDLADPTAGTIAEIALPPPPGESDGNPNASSIAIVGDRAYVTLQHLDDAIFAPLAPGEVVVIDTTSDTVVDAFELSTDNPLNHAILRGDELLVGTNDFASGAGCIERVATGTTPDALGCLVDNAALGGSAATFAGGAELFAVVTYYDGMGAPQGKIVPIAGDGTVGQSLTGAGPVPTDLAYCAGTDQLVYADQGTGGLRVLDAASGDEITTAPLDLGLPPSFVNGIVCY